LPSPSLNRYGLWSLLPALETDSTDEIVSNSLGTDPLSPPVLPALTIEAQGETALSTVSGGALLPCIGLEIRVGYAVSGVLPVPEISASGSFIQALNLNGELPALSLDATTGIRCGTLTLSFPELSISGVGDLVGRLDRQMPGLGLSATGVSQNLASLTGSIAALSLSVSMSATGSGSLSKSLPSLQISASGSLNHYGLLDAALPGLLVSSGEAHQSSMNLDADLPTLIVQLAGHGASGIGGAGSTLANNERFADYVLRHSR
jgi:hypothetical protein